MSDLLQGFNLGELLSLREEDIEKVRGIIDEALRVVERNDIAEFADERKCDPCFKDERKCHPCSPVKFSTIRIGSVRTGAPGSCATVSNSGTNTNAVLNFTIPRGADGTSNTNTELGCSRAQMRNILSQIVRCFEDSEISLTLYDGTKLNNLRLLDICPECNPIYVKVKDCTVNKTRVLLVDSIAQISVFTSKCLPCLKFRRCCSRFTNPITSSLCVGKEADLIVNGYHSTCGVVEHVCNGMVVLASHCPSRIDFIASAALIGFTSC